MNQARTELIAGLDEVGMGALAGPLVIAVTVFDSQCVPIPGVKDSKKTTKRARETLIDAIVEQAQYVGLGYAPVECINRRGLAMAWQEAAEMALDGCPAADVLIIDGDRGVASWTGHQEVIQKADALHWQVSAASIVAKLLRDQHMVRLHELGPHYQKYGWDTNVGYGSKLHNAAVIEHGICDQHRSLFVRKLLARRTFKQTRSST